MISISNLRFRFRSQNFDFNSISTQNLKIETQSRLFSRFRNQKLRRHDHRHIKTGGGIEEPNARLAANICQVTEVPGHQVVNLMTGGNRHVQRVGNVFAMKYSARNITVREYRCFFSELNLFQRRRSSSDRTSDAAR